MSGRLQFIFQAVWHPLKLQKAPVKDGSVSVSEPVSDEENGVGQDGEQEKKGSKKVEARGEFPLGNFELTRTAFQAAVRGILVVQHRMGVREIQKVNDSSCHLCPTVAKVRELEEQPLVARKNRFNFRVVGGVSSSLKEEACLPSAEPVSLLGLPSLHIDVRMQYAFKGTLDCDKLRVRISRLDSIEEGTECKSMRINEGIDLRGPVSTPIF